MDVTQFTDRMDDERLKWLIYFGVLAVECGSFELTSEEVIRSNRPLPEDFLPKLEAAIGKAKAGLDELYATVKQDLQERSHGA